MLLKNFCDESGNLWHFNKKAPKLGVKSGPPHSIFYETHLYTLEERGLKDTSLETYFSKLESSVNVIIDKICVAARKMKPPQLSAQEKGDWDQFFYFQWMRTPDTINSTVSDAEFEKWLVSSLDKFERVVRPLSDQERNDILAEQAKKRIRKNANVQAIANPAPLTQTALQGMGIAVAVLPKQKKSFVIGSRPVVKLTPPGETRLGQPGVEVWLPIAADVAVCMVPGKGTELVVPLNDDGQLRKLNMSILSQSTMIAGRSKALIHSLITSNGAKP